MKRQTFTCDSDCPLVTRTHFSRAAVDECRAKRSRGGPARAAALRPQAQQAFDLVMTHGNDYSGAHVDEDLDDAAMWRPTFRSAVIDMEALRIEGAYLPGADFRGVQSREHVPGLPVHMMTEARGAIIDDALYEEATVGHRSWLLRDVDRTPPTREARLALDFVVPFLQWSFTDSQWTRLTSQGYDEDELVSAAQEFPPRNEAGFVLLMDTGSVSRAATLAPHAESWGARELVTPPLSNAQSRQLSRGR